MIDRVLVVDDEFLIRELLEETISRQGIEVVAAASGEEAVEILGREEFQMIFSDLKMGVMGGMDLLRHCVVKCPASLFVIMTAYGSVETAVEAMRLGAFDFIIKPFSPDQTDVLIEKARHWLQVNAANAYLRRELGPAASGLGAKIVGSSARMKEVARLVNRVAVTDATVLITGESGTGKELVASEIHRLFDPEGAKPYIRMNCAAVPETLLESELFGHEKGSFTGATERRTGRFELADNGTLLLDEIGEISVAMQAKLLRVLQESEFERVGGSKTVKVKVRVVATTNRELRKEVAAGRFREDLFYRLNVFPIHLPALRERDGDAAEIAAYFLKKQAEKLRRPLTFSETALRCVANYQWPGNIRELENVVERVAILEDGPIIGLEALPWELARPTTAQITGRGADQAGEELFNIDELERQTVFRALRKTGGNRGKAADLLGFSVRTLRNKLNEYKDKGTLDVEFADLAGGEG